MRSIKHYKIEQNNTILWKTQDKQTIYSRIGPRILLASWISFTITVTRLA